MAHVNIPINEYPPFIKVVTDTPGETLYMKQYNRGYLVVSNTNILFYYMAGIPLKFTLISEEDADTFFQHTANKLNEILNT